MRRKAGGEVADSGYGGATGGSSASGSERSRQSRQDVRAETGTAPAQEPERPDHSRQDTRPETGTAAAYEIAADDFQPHSFGGGSARGRNGDTQGALEIEFEDDNGSAPLPYPAGRSRDLR